MGCGCDLIFQLNPVSHKNSNYSRQPKSKLYKTYFSIKFDKAILNFKFATISNATLLCPKNHRIS